VGNENNGGQGRTCLSSTLRRAIDPGLGSYHPHAFKDFFTLKESFLAHQLHQRFNENHVVVGDLLEGADNGPGPGRVRDGASIHAVPGSSAVKMTLFLGLLLGELCRVSNPDSPPVRVRPAAGRPNDRVKAAARQEVAFQGFRCFNSPPMLWAPGATSRVTRLGE
jgi:hypothetical protein